MSESERITFVEEGVERVQAAYQSMEDELQKIQRQLQERSNEFSEKAEQRMKSFGEELRKYSVVRKAESLRDDVSKEIEKQGRWIEKRVEKSVDSVLDALRLAPRSEIERLDKKLNRISRRLAALDKSIAQANGEELKATPSKPETAIAE